MTRIIAGSFGGRQIKVPKGDGTRPTSDRVREALFSSLESELGGFDSELRVLDLFAGSGALGLESMSRGAGQATFVESDARAAGVIQANVRELGLSGAEVVRIQAATFVDRAEHLQFGLVFIDPPYAMATPEVAALVGRLASTAGAEALFVVERATRDRFEWPDGMEPLRSKKYGETTLWYGRPRD